MEIDNKRMGSCSKIIPIVTHDTNVYTTVYWPRKINFGNQKSLTNLAEIPRNHFYGEQ